MAVQVSESDQIKQVIKIGTHSLLAVANKGAELISVCSTKPSQLPGQTGRMLTS